MAKVRKDLNHGHVRWVVDWYDEFGARRREFFETKGAADEKLSAVLTGHRLMPAIDPTCILRDYAARWLAANKPDWKPRTYRSYEDTLALHLLPFPINATTVLGDVRVARVRKGYVKSLLVAKRA